ncbi:MAG: hypothetical protein OMM_07419, partial [Candidatus Magnetoglobus multicellularis str. Araruama]
MLFISTVFAQSLPQGLAVQEDYAPGMGLSLGKIKLVQGEAVIIHYHDSQVGYKAKTGQPLYQKDKIITLNTGRVSFQLNDGSQMSMSTNATMTINKSVFDPIKSDRTVFMNMPKGKSRFTVRKLKKFRRSAVKIKTATAIIGVRGSDFIVMASEQKTEIVTLDETILEVNSLFDPTAQAVLLQSYERSEVESDALPTTPEPVRPEEIESIMEDFSFSADTASTVKRPESQSSGHEKKSKPVSQSSETSQSSDTSKSKEKQPVETSKTETEKQPDETAKTDSAPKAAEPKTDRSRPGPAPIVETKSPPPAEMQSLDRASAQPLPVLMSVN